VRFGWIDAAMVALVGWWSVAALMGSAHAAPRPSLNMLWEGVAILLTFVLLRQLVEPDSAGRETRALVAVMIALAVTLAVIAVAQYFVLMPAWRARFVENPAAMFREAQIEASAPGTRAFRTFADRLNSPEPIATFSLTNSLAAFLAPWLVISLGVALAGWHVSQLRPTGPRSWLAAGGCALLLAVALAMTRSRSAWIGTLVGAACLVMWRLAALRQAQRRRTESIGSGPRRLGSRTRLAAIVALSMVVLGGGAIAVRPQLLEPAMRSFQVRLDYWRATCAMIADRPCWGCGPGNFGEYYTPYKLPTGTEEIKDPHNFALEVAASAGLPALILLLTVLAGFARVVARALPRASSSATAAPQTERPPADGARWIFCGAIVGFWLAVGWNKIVGFPEQPWQAIVGMLVTVIVWWLFWPWIERGSLPPRLCGISLLTLLVALLAVGGITFGGVNETLWLLLALGLNAAEFRPAAAPADADKMAADNKKTLPWSVNVPLLAAVVGLAVAQHQTAYGPVLGCQAALDAARGYGARGELPDQEHQLLVAADADPYAVEPPQLLASLRLGQWSHGDKQGHHDSKFSSELIGDFENWINRALNVDPLSAPLWLEAGMGWLKVFDGTKLPADGRKAVEFCRRAAELYPTGVAVQFDLAQALWETGEPAAAKAAAREALRLDDLRPESLRALDDEQRKLAERIILGDNQLVAPKPAGQPATVPLGPPPPLPPQLR
jgi:O-antigen ligase